MARSQVQRQLSLPVRNGWGGARAGAGRKPGRRPLVRHRARAAHKRRFPVHVTLRAQRVLASLRAAGRSGPVWGDRYHSRDLATPREVRHALCYVLHNSRKHGREAAVVDPCSSARWFDGWRDHDVVVDLAAEPPPVVRPRTWLMAIGWRRHGLLRLDEQPAGCG